MVEPVPEIKDQSKLASWLGDAGHDGKSVRTKLQASDRVIARVTDGIYRQPASALRELISNAWDADANNVTILTDAPRYSRIFVRDDGLGMSHETLARLLKNIGGSAKRRDEGSALGITSSTDTEKTPSGRPLIGKIGIGLFSVSQLARRFRIVTKVKGQDYQLVADVALRAYEDNPSDEHAEDDDRFLSGDVLIQRQKAKRSAHGTDIVLDELKPPVRDLLRSAGRWRSIEDKEEAIAKGDLETAASVRTVEPAYHSGWMSELSDSGASPDMLTRPAKLPWRESDPPETRMAKLVQAVRGESTRKDRPDLATTLDSYLEMMWTLGLSAPVRYIDAHPFDLKSSRRLKLFWISDRRGRGQHIPMKRGQTVREAVAEHAPGNPRLTEGEDANGTFRVQIDGVELRRPISYEFIKTEKRGLDSAYLFVGKFAPDLKNVAASKRGGNLALEGYLFWTGRVIPKENNGVLVRIRGASGALFDRTFFEYPVAEITRLKQITSELFVQKGLDAALNIDRESFNFAHPHFGLVSKWLHASIRQLTNRLKADAADLRATRKEADASSERQKVNSIAESVWEAKRGVSDLPDVAIVQTETEARNARREGSIAFTREAVPRTGEAREADAKDSQAVALIQVLTAFDVLDDRSYTEQQELIRAILDIFADTRR